MRRTSKVIFVIGLLAIVCLLALGVTRYREANSEAARWAALSDQRALNLRCRYLPSFETFLRRSLYGNLSTAYLWFVPFRGMKENDVPDIGILVDDSDGRWVGTCHAMLFFRDWSADPSSAEFHLHLDKELLAKLPKLELAYVLTSAQTPTASSGRFGDVDWRVVRDDSGAVDLTMRVSYPARWMENIPEYRRGFTDELQSRVARRVFAFLEREALNDENTPIFMSSPLLNPPNYQEVDGRRIGLANGYVRTPDRKLVPMEISTSERDRESTLTIKLGSPNWSVASDPTAKFSMDDAKKLFKASFLSRAGSESSQGMNVSETDSMGVFTLTIRCPLDFPIETVRLGQLSWTKIGTWP